jgi:hypothetical protein
MAPRLCDSLRHAIRYIERACTGAFSCLTRRTVSMVLPGKQPGLLVAVIVPAFLSTLIVVARSMRKVKRRPKYISKAGAIAAESLLIASVVCIFSVLGAYTGHSTEQCYRSQAGSLEFSSLSHYTMVSAYIWMRFCQSPMECKILLMLPFGRLQDTVSETIH